MQDADLRLLETIIFLPPMVMRDCLRGASEAERLTGMVHKEYQRRLDDYAFGNPRDYSGFREFLRTHSALFCGRYPLLESMTDKDVDYVLNRWREEEVKGLLETAFPVKDGA